MAYKDKDKQREANREASQRRRDANKVKGMMAEGAKTIIVIPEHPVPVIPKRGKDIKCFEDLPVDVQETIDRLSDTTEEHIKRTEAVINYQHVNEGVSPSSSPSGETWRAERGR